MGRELPIGIRKVPDGFQAYVWVIDKTKPKGGYQAAKRFPPDTAISEMKSWRMKRKLNLPDVIPLTTFADDAADYLAREKVKRMPTHQERVRHILEWVKVFGNHDRSKIEPHEIQSILDRLTGFLAAGSVNKRRTALMDLWTTLDGRHKANPVKATHDYEEPHPEPRAPALAVVLTLLRLMPTKTDYAKKCKARCAVIAWTGWPHAILKQLEPTDIDWKAKTAFVHRRRKGKGARARVLPLLPEAVKALKQFDRVDAYGPFSNSSLHKRVTWVCQKKKLPRIRVYDLRHFFGSLIATLTRDERAVQELMLLSTQEQARRYTEAATDPRVQAAVGEVARELPDLLRAARALGQGHPVPDSASTLPRKRKRRETGAKRPSRPPFTRRGSVVRIH